MVQKVAFGYEHSIKEIHDMKTLLQCMVILLVVSSGVRAEEKPAIRLWPNGLPEGARPVDPNRIEALKAKQTSQRITYVEHPSITLFRAPAEKANGCAVVVCPGGGYNILAWEKEGIEIAEWFNSLGVTAVVLKYRVPRRDPRELHREPLQDAQRAIRLVRKHAPRWGVDSRRVGILGFSAGGHLTIMAGTHWDERTYDKVDDADDLSCRPDFMCPIYAAYLADEYKDNVAELGPLVKVTSETPPTFMAVTQDDKMRGAQAALLFVELTKADVPAELHVYTKGGHGYGIRPSENPVSTWHHRLAEWIDVTCCK
jgi:acetyl esterase/lipase